VINVTLDRHPENHGMENMAWKTWHGKHGMEIVAWKTLVVEQ